MKISAVVIVILALTLASCGIRRVGPSSGEESAPSEAPMFDPLATSQDREVVPEVHPVVTASAPSAGDTLATPGNISRLELDTAAAATGPTEVYRVQIFTSRLYTEANRERALADEIFNLPIYLDYEVPYYKLRVGDFQTREEAENMVAEIKSVGYNNAWVARVVLKVHEAPEYGPMDEPILPADSTDSLALPSDSAILEGGGDDR